MKKIFQYGPDDFRIEETKSVKIVSTANIKVLDKEIENLGQKIDELAALRDSRKALLKEIKDSEK